MAIFDSAARNPVVRPREVVAWAGYDLANTGYTTIVLTAVSTRDYNAAIPAFAI